MDDALRKQRRDGCPHTKQRTDRGRYLNFSLSLKSKSLGIGKSFMSLRSGKSFMSLKSRKGGLTVSLPFSKIRVSFTPNLSSHSNILIASLPPVDSRTTCVGGPIFASTSFWLIPTSTLA